MEVLKDEKADATRRSTALELLSWGCPPLKDIAPPEEYAAIRKLILEAISSKEKLEAEKTNKVVFIKAAACLVRGERAEEVTRAVFEFLFDQDQEVRSAALYVLREFSRYKLSPEWLGLSSVQIEIIMNYAQALPPDSYAVDICANLLRPFNEKRKNP